MTLDNLEKSAIIFAAFGMVVIGFAVFDLGFDTRINIADHERIDRLIVGFSIIGIEIVALVIFVRKPKSLTRQA